MELAIENSGSGIVRLVYCGMAHGYGVSFDGWDSRSISYVMSEDDMIIERMPSMEQELLLPCFVLGPPKLVCPGIFSIVFLSSLDERQLLSAFKLCKFDSLPSIHVTTQTGRGINIAPEKNSM